VLTTPDGAASAERAEGWPDMTDEHWNDEAERRLVALEMRLSHHEVMAEELSEVVAQQARTIDLLTAELRRLRGRMAEAEAALPASPQDDKPPPHY
jgi:SlyX protein